MIVVCKRTAQLASGLWFSILNSDKMYSRSRNSSEECVLRSREVELRGTGEAVDSDHEHLHAIDEAFVLWDI